MKRKQWLSIALTLVLILSLAACSGSGGSPQSSSEAPASAAGDSTAGSSPAETVPSGDIETLVVTARTFGSAPNELSLVQEEISKITREKIGAEIQLEIIQSGSYAQQMTLMLSGNEQLDAMGATRVVFMSAINNDQLRPLEDLLAQHGQGILSEIGEEYLKAGKVGGTLYGVTTNRDHARGYGGWVLRTDILEKYDIDVSNVNTIEALTDVFATVKENEPEMIIVAPNTVGNSFLQHYVDFDNLGDYFGVLLNHGEELVVENLFTSDSYRHYLDFVRDWYQKDYISKDIVNATEAGPSLMKAGNLFASIEAGKPGIESQDSLTAGYDVTYVQTLDTFTSTAAPQTFQWTVPENSRNPEKAMQFLNLMYTDPDVMNLLAWGIEGQHYEVKDDGLIGFPEGVNANNSGYNLSMAWQFGNQFIAHIWEGNEPDIWEQTAAFNKTGKFSKAMGFSFDNSAVANEVAAVQNAYDEYRMSLECGVVDPDEALPQMLEKLDRAGLGTIIEEKQRQLDEWAQLEGIA